MNKPTLEPLSQTEQIEQTQALLAFEGELSIINRKALMTSLPHSKGEQINVPLDRVQFYPDFNPRIKDADHVQHIRGIANSIKELGYFPHKPLSVVPGFDGKRQVLFVVEGSCRLEGVLLAVSEGASTDELPVVICDRSITMEDLTFSLVKSNSGKKFKTLELAIAVKRLFTFSRNIQKIAEKLDFTPEYVRQLLDIAGAPTKIRSMIEIGEVPAAVALQSMKIHGDNTIAVLEKAVTEAKAQGRTGITRKHLPEQIRKKALTKAAPTMITAIERIKADVAFQALPTDLQELIDGILKGVAEVTPKEVAATASTNEAENTSATKSLWAEHDN